MPNPAEQVGTDIADAGRKLGHAVATGASAVKDVLVGKSGDNVPAPPGFDWGSTYKGLAEGWADQRATEYKEEQDAIKTRQKYNEGMVSEQDFKLKMDQLNFDKLTRESDIVKELRGLDMSKPESVNRRKELFEEYALLNGKSLTSGRPNYATGRTLEAAVKAHIDVSRPMSEWTEQELGEQLASGFDALRSSSSQTTETDRSSGMTYTRTTNKSAGAVHDPSIHATPVPPPPAHLGGGAATPKVGPGSGSGKSSVYNTPQIRADYDRAMKGATLTGNKATNVAAYANAMGLPLPHQANKPIDTQIKSVEDAQERLNMMEADAASPNGPNDVDLLWNHLGMTAAGQKGVRVTKNIIDEAVNARPIGENWGVRWHKIADGTFLSPQQRREFVELAKRRTEQERIKLESIRKELGGDSGAGEVPPAPGGTLLDTLSTPIPASTPR